MSDSAIIKPAHSPCKMCVFAEYDGITQKDCHLGFLDKYRANNIEIIEAYDEEKEFYIINGKKCFGYKEENYFKSRNLENSSIEEKIEYVKDKLKINYIVVVNINKFTMENISLLFCEINNLSIKPQTIILIRYQDQKNVYTYEKLKTLLDQNITKIKWKIQTLLDNEESYMSRLHMVTNTHKNNNFVLSINGNYDNINKIIDYAQNIAYEKFGSFGVLSNSSKDSIFYNSMVYRTGITHGIDILSAKEEYDVI